MGFSTPDLGETPPPPMPATYATSDVQAAGASSAQRRARAAAGASSITNQRRQGVGSTDTAQKQLVGE